MQYEFTNLTTVGNGSEELQLSFTLPYFFKPGQALTFGDQGVLVAGYVHTVGMPVVLKVVALSATIRAKTVGAIEVDDVQRVAKHLSVSEALVPRLESDIRFYLGQRPVYQRQLSDYLAELDALSRRTATQGQDDNLNLIKAGSLEWSQGGKLAATTTRQNELRDQLSTLLGGRWWKRGGGVGSCTKVMRG